MMPTSCGYVLPLASPHHAPAKALLARKYWSVHERPARAVPADEVDAQERGTAVDVVVVEEHDLVVSEAHRLGPRAVDGTVPGQDLGHATRVHRRPVALGGGPGQRGRPADHYAGRGRRALAAQV